MSLQILLDFNDIMIRNHPSLGLSFLEALQVLRAMPEEKA